MEPVEKPLPVHSQEARKATLRLRARRGRVTVKHISFLPAADSLVHVEVEKLLVIELTDCTVSDSLPTIADQ